MKSKYILLSNTHPENKPQIFKLTNRKVDRYSFYEDAWVINTIPYIDRKLEAMCIGGNAIEISLEYVNALINLENAKC